MVKKPSSAIRVRLLGDASITTDIATIEPNAEILFAAALYLVLERKDSVTRRTVQALLWPDESNRVAAHRLRQTLLKLRQLGVPIALSGQGRIGLNGASVSVDYEEFLAKRAGVENGSNDALVMLPAYEPRFSETYLEWLDAQKAEVNAAMTRVMLGVIARHRVKGEWTDVERNAARLLRFQPYNEEATLAMAESCAMRGAKLDAMAILDKYLSDVGSGPTDLRLPATIMRRRIADRVHPRADAIAGQSPLFGRAAEMEKLGELLSRCRQKKGQTCIVWGDAGVGKSRLIAEFATFASLQGIPTQRVQCRPNDAHRPLSVFMDLVPALRTMRGAIGCSPETFSYLDRLTKHKPATFDRTEDQSDSEFVYSKVEQALFDLVDAVSDEQCLILQVEDVHWLDPESAKLLREMVAWGGERRILFALTGRDPADASLLRLADRVSEMHLAPLGREPSKDVILAVVREHGREIGEEYLDWCVTVAEGNPYFLQELANQWVERGDEHAAPLSLAAVLNDRISRLTPDALLLLQTCALLEKSSTLDRVEKALGFEAHRMLRAIDELGIAGMLMIESDESLKRGADRISSRHDLLSNAALSRLTPPARAFLHRRIGTVFEEEIDHERSASILWDCTKHWQLAGDEARAFRLAKSCATHLMEVGLPGAAADAYEKSLAYCRTPEDRFEALEGLAHAYHGSSAWGRARQVVGKARALRHKLHPDADQHDDLELIGIRAERGYRLSKQTISKALTCLNSSEASSEHRVRAGNLALMMLDSTCQQEQMPIAYRTIEKIAATTEVSLAARLEAKMVYHTICGSLTEAVDATQLMLANERLRASPGDLCRRLCNAAIVFRTADLMDEALAFLSEGEQLAVKHKLTSASFHVFAAFANCELERGNFSQAQHWFEKFAATSPRLRTPYVRGEIAALGALLALCDRNVPLARRRLRMSLDDIMTGVPSQSRTYELAVYVAIQLAEGSVDPLAVDALEDAHLFARRNLAQGFTAVVLNGALLSLNRHERAESLLEDYVTKFRREKAPIPPTVFEMFTSTTTNPKEVPFS